MRRLVVAGVALALFASALGLAPATADDSVPTDPGMSCVGSPPRQTFDPLSPPCIPYFDGDNGCDTYSIGVTCDEVKIVVYLEGGYNYTTGSGGPGSDHNIAPSGGFYDLWKTREENNLANGYASEAQEHLTLQGLRVWQDYFNSRFQTYSRDVHFYVYYSWTGAGTPERRAQDARLIRWRVPGEPFAVVSYATDGAEDVLLSELNRKGILTFGDVEPRTLTTYNKHPRMMWSTRPSVDRLADNYSSYVCSQVVGRAPVLAGPVIRAQNQLPSALGGNDGVRKLGMLSSGDQDPSGLVALPYEIEERVEACGGEVFLKRTFPNCCWAVKTTENPDYALQHMAEFQSQGITTILWAGGLNPNYGAAAAALGYEPEWILAGDGMLDANAPTVVSKNSAAFHGRAIVITPRPIEGALEEQICSRAYRESNQATTREDLSYTCDFYEQLFQLFVGIQVTGPYLGPTNFSKGMHAIPAREGTPDTPGCYYLTDDYSCVKDAQAEIWDATGLPPGSNTPGCWRPIEGGDRHDPDFDPWPTDNIDAGIHPGQPCNGYSTSSRLGLT